MTKLIIAIGVLTSYPWRAVKLFFRVPNALILYKSGNSRKFFARNLNVTRKGSTVTEITWETADSKILFVGIDNIEAVFMLW